MNDLDLDNTSGTAAAIDAGLALGTLTEAPIDLDENNIVVVVPPGFTTREYDRRQLRGDCPLWVSARRHFEDTASLLAYLEVHQPTKPIAYIDAMGCKAEVILDDHTAEGTARTAHAAHLTLCKTEAWEAWAAVSGTLMDQQAFAELVEDRIADIARPAGADLLELAQSFHAIGTAQFRSDQRLSNGNVRLSYLEETTASAGRDGTMEVPQTITLVLAPFEGAERKSIDARLRYRLNGGKLRIGVILNDPNQFLRDAVAAEFTKLANGYPAAVLLNGRSR